jgi:hypothetical protein
MLRLMESLGDLPSVLLGRRLDILATNPAARLLFAEFNLMPAQERNALRWGLLTEQARQLHGEDWENAMAGLVGMLRLDAGRHPNDPRLRELVEELSAKSEVFTRLWKRGHVAANVTPDSGVFQHPLVGRVCFRVEVLSAPQERDQLLKVMIPADAATESAMRRLQTAVRTG